MKRCRQQRSSSKLAKVLFVGTYWIATSSVTGCVTKGNYVQQHYDVTYVLLAASTSGKSSKGGAYEVVLRKVIQ
jgi:hypothetical protein